MNYKKENQFYKRNIKIGIAVSLLIVIFTFLLIPKLNRHEKYITYFEEPIITLEDIPVTKIINTSPPKINLDLITKKVLIDEPIALSDVEINEINENIIDNPPKQVEDVLNQENSYNPINKFFIPEQIVEVIPANKNKLEGFVTLELIIDSDGKIKEYKILDSSLSNEEISFLIEKIIKSKWGPSNQSESEYKIVKIYSFQ